MKPKNKLLKNTGTGIRQQMERILGWTAASPTGMEKGKPYLKDCDGILALHFDAVAIQSDRCRGSGPQPTTP